MLLGGGYLPLSRAVHSQTLLDMEKLTRCNGQALQNAVERLSKYLTTLEEKMEALERRKK